MNTCLDCGKEISKNAKRCRICNNKTRVGKLNPMYNKTHKEESKIKTSKTLKEKYKKEKHHLKGKKQSNEHIDKRIKAVNRDEVYRKKMAKISKESYYKYNKKDILTFKNKHHSKETKKTISEAQIGEKNHMYGRCGKDNPNFGTKRSAKTKNNISKAVLQRDPSTYLRGKDNPASRPEVAVKIGNSNRGKKRSKKVCEHLRKISMGENNPNWRGGTSFEPYGIEFNERLKNKIRDRDGHRCMLCGLRENGRKHDVHHIDYDKKNSSVYNLVTLCKWCHTQTNFNRSYWEMFLTEMKSFFNRCDEEYLKTIQKGGVITYEDICGCLVCSDAT